MAAWIPLIKTALPYVVQVLSIAIPAFTAKSNDTKTTEFVPEEITGQISEQIAGQIDGQITELQLAATQNAESVRILAEQLKATIEGIDTAAIKLQQELKSLRLLCFIAMLIAAVSFACVAWVLFR